MLTRSVLQHHNTSQMAFSFCASTPHRYRYRAPFRPTDAADTPGPFGLRIPRPNRSPVYRKRQPPQHPRSRVPLKTKEATPQRRPGPPSGSHVQSCTRFPPFGHSTQAPSRGRKLEGLRRGLSAPVTSARPGRSLLVRSGISYSATAFVRFQCHQCSL